MSAAIAIARLSDEPLVFEATIEEAGSATRHRVTLSQQDVGRLRHGAAPEAIVEAAFRFLLDREPKDPDSARFDISLISQYFPDFETRLIDYLS